jgi:hypothetical protein
MKRFYALLSALLLCGLMLHHSAEAQRGRKAKRAEMKAKSREMSKFTVKSKFGRSKQYASVGGFIGATNYFGDLAPRTNRASTSLDLTRLYIGGYYNKRINANISVRFGLAYGRLKGDDATADRSSENGEYRYRRNLSFRNDIIEAQVTGLIDILPTDKGYLRRNFFNGYGMLGLSLFYHNPKGKVPAGLGLANEDKWVALRPLGTEGQGLDGYKKRYSLFQPAILVGLGARYRINDKIDVGLEIGWRFTFTDYLDDVGGNYAQDKDAIAAGKDDLWWALSNKSGQINTSSDETRTFPEKIFYEPIPGLSNTAIRRIIGFEYRVDMEPDVNGTLIPIEKVGSPRYNKQLDGFIVTTATVNYILEFRARTPKFR